MTRDVDRSVSEFDKYKTMAARSKKPTLTADQFQAVAKALADPRRMALLESIASESEYSCQQLCLESGVSKGTVSHHFSNFSQSLASPVQ